MRKNKIGDILFGLLLLGFILSNLTGCGQARQPPYAVPRYTETSAARETDESSAVQKQVVFTGPEDKDCTSYVIPDGVTEIGEDAFAGCSSLTSVEIPDSVKVISPYAFCDCSSLTSIKIPDGVTEIGEGAFAGCSSLTGVEIPDSVKTIYGYAFSGCSSLTKIEIPNSVTKMEGEVFAGCSSLADVKLPDGVTEISGSTFADCSSLTSIEIPDSVKAIYSYAFSGCRSLTEIEIPDSVAEIDKNAFCDCISLTSVTLPKNLDIDLSEVFGARYTNIQFVYKDENSSVALPGEIIVEDESDMADSESETETNADNDARMPEADFVVGSSAEAIAKVCGLTAPVEEDVRACHWDSYGEHPYDVVYDYGEEYRAYVDACDWSLVFDAEYYMEQFPMLALQYHYDEEELLFHFQTVGVHEGRQGCEEFNFAAYMMNGDPEVRAMFHCNPEGYYLYYMLNYDTEKDANTVYREDGKPARVMYYYHPTALQKAEQDAVNADRKDVDAGTLTMVSETCALANYRAYINAHDGYEAHDWAYDNIDAMVDYTNMIGGEKFAENTVTWHYGSVCGKIAEPYYYGSQSHYNAMVAEKYAYIGVSNICNGKHSSSQFDYFIDAVK